MRQGSGPRTQARCVPAGGKHQEFSKVRLCLSDLFGFLQEVELAKNRWDCTMKLMSFVERLHSKYNPQRKETKTPPKKTEFGRAQLNLRSQ